MANDLGTEAKPLRVAIIGSGPRNSNLVAGLKSGGEKSISGIGDSIRIRRVLTERYRRSAPLYLQLLGSARGRYIELKSENMVYNKF